MHLKSSSSGIVEEQPAPPASVLDFESFDFEELVQKLRDKTNVKEALKVEGLVAQFEGLGMGSDPHDTDNEPLDSFDSNVPSTPIPPEPPPGSLLSDIARPPPPTNICDFPYFDLKPPDADYKLNPRSTLTLLKFSVNHASLHQIHNRIFGSQRKTLMTWMTMK
jgi:hypothetical protein